LPKEQLSFKPSNWALLQNTNLKEELFSFKAEYLHELIGKAVHWMDKENIPLKTSWSLLMI
jgi:hypothetical protein